MLTRKSTRRQASLAVASANKETTSSTRSSRQRKTESKSNSNANASKSKQVLKVKAENIFSPNVNNSAATARQEMVTISSANTSTSVKRTMSPSIRHRVKSGSDLGCRNSEEVENAGLAAPGPPPAKSPRKDVSSLKEKIEDTVRSLSPRKIKAEQQGQETQRKDNVADPSVEKTPQVVKSESDSDDDSVNGDDSMNYLKLREQNLKANEEFFAKLGIENAKLQVQASLPGRKKSMPTQRGLKVKKEAPEPLPRRQSMRIRRVDPLGVPLPPVPDPVPEPVEERLPSGPLNMKDHIYSKAENNSEENMKVFSNEISKLDFAKSASKSDMKSLIAELNRVTLSEDRVAKVVPGRVFSVTWNPSNSVLLTAAGDKYGHVGLWNILRDDSEGSVLTFKPHCKPVSHLLFPAAAPNKLFSCSYDATLRCGDFEKGVFDEVFSVPEEDDDLFRNFDFVDDRHTLLVSQFRGKVSLVDLRTPKTSADQVYAVSYKSLRTVSVNPAHSFYFITAGVDATIKLWDRRCISTGTNKPPKPVQILANHSKSIASAYFSPDTGKKILSSSADDTILIHSQKESSSFEFELSKRIRHNNHTGRWLTNFKPEWHPFVPDVFLTGSMGRPREIEVFGADGHRIKSLTSEDYLGSVCSLNAFHPGRSSCTIVGANSSGRLHVFM